MTVFINHRRVVHQGVSGNLHTISINLTGPNKIPVAYRNVARIDDLTDTEKNILINGHPVATINSKITRSQGDEAGYHGGIYSKTVNGPAEFLTASSTVVTIHGDGLLREGDLGVSNHRNTNINALLLSP